MICLGTFERFIPGGLSLCGRSFCVTRLAPACRPRARACWRPRWALPCWPPLPALAALALASPWRRRSWPSRRATVLGECLRTEARVPRAQKSGGAPLGWPSWLCVLPASLRWPLFTHTLYLKGGAYWCGQSTYGDLPMHLAFIQSIAQQGDFPPHYPCWRRRGLRLPVLCETVSSVFLLLGAGLARMPSPPAWRCWRCSAGAGCWPTPSWAGGQGKPCPNGCFFMGSGFGFASSAGAIRAASPGFSPLLRNPTNYVQENVRWVNPVVDLLIPSGPPLMGWALLFPALFLLARFALQGKSICGKALVLLAAPCPLCTPTRRLPWCWCAPCCFLRQLAVGRTPKAALGPGLPFAGLAAAAWLPQVLPGAARNTGGRGLLRWHFNWANEGDGSFGFTSKHRAGLSAAGARLFLWAGARCAGCMAGGF